MKKLCLELRSSNRKILNQLLYSLFSVFKKKKKNSTFFYLPRCKKFITILNSPHVNKRSQRRFSFMIYKAFAVLKVFDVVFFRKTLLIFLFNIGVSFNIKILS